MLKRQLSSCFKFVNYLLTFFYERLKKINWYKEDKINIDDKIAKEDLPKSIVNKVQKVNRKSNTLNKAKNNNEYEIDKDGYPLNPIGRTGITEQITLVLYIKIN